MSWKLNKTSTIIGQPTNLKIPLKKHQLAMLYRCLSIEKNIYTNNEYPYGIMCDKAGAGKTAVIISLILADKMLCGKTQNLIVVPQNIHTQWIKEFEKFAGDSIKVKSFIEYADISGLFMDPTMIKENEYDVLITTTLYYDMIINTLRQNSIAIKRLIFDEIDTVASSVMNNMEEKYRFNIKRSTEEEKTDEKYMEANNKIVWFISASFENCVTEQGFTFRNKHVSLDNLHKIMCQCENEFIDKNFEMPEPMIINHICDDLTDDYFECLSPQQLDYINSLSFQNIRSEFTNKIASNTHDVMKIIIEDYSIAIEKNENLIASFKSVMMKEKNKDVIATANADIVFYNQLLKACHDIKCSKQCEDKVKCIREQIESIKYSNTKIAKIETFIQNINKDTDKVLIFSDFTGSFKLVSALLEKYNVKYTELDGGNTKSIDKSIELYKEKDTCVLMIDSSSQGCGMNLENTTHLIFIHKTGESLHNQIIGRAQRPGRTNQLSIISLLNNNEIVE